MAGVQSPPGRVGPTMCTLGPALQASLDKTHPLIDRLAVKAVIMRGLGQAISMMGTSRRGILSLSKISAICSSSTEGLRYHLHGKHVQYSSVSPGEHRKYRLRRHLQPFLVYPYAQKYVINTLFSIFTAWPQSAPLTIMRISARILHIGGSRPGTGTAIRITQSPLKEWHAFATIPEQTRNEFSLIVSRARARTANIIDNPPTKLWIRSIPTNGALRNVPMSRGMVLVATGSGICPCVNTNFEGRILVRLLCTSPNVRVAFGDEFVDQILCYAPGTILCDTRKHGKPDLVKLALNS
ncbi:hypothetical protein BJ322DRAFT_1183701 [Thelephora terrestris]|uniref:Uncharacterized protein n=1 Tax=Thelephora terrestris TaxID=56493 RepID=A0A9P6L9R5_9AGAM|nr:hypothetical protein BJ322DRAFT_1183701 [Thelephora terrestris]